MASFDKALHGLKLTFALLATVLNGISLSFNVYAVTLKGTFNFTQTQVEIAASAFEIGTGMGFVEIFLTGVFGYTATFLVTYITMPLVCGLHSVAAIYPDFFHQWPVLVYIFQFFLGTGFAVAIVIVVRVSLEIISKDYMATLMGAFGASLCFGKILYAGILELFFPGDLCGFFLCLSVMFAFVQGICFMLLYPTAMKITLKTGSSRETEKPDVKEDWEFRDIIQSQFFHLMFWSSTLFSGCTYTLLNNITSITDSIGIKDPFTTVTIMSACIMTTRLLYGFIIDKAASLTCDFLLLFSGYFSTGVGVCIGMFFLNTTTVHALTVLSGVGVGIAFNIPLTILVNQYGKSNYSFLCTAHTAVVGVFTMLDQVLTGFLYDKKRVQLEIKDNYCFGPDCFFWSLFFQLILIFIVVFTQSINFYFSRKRKPQNCTIPGL